ncbi:uncharacterized protein LOC130772868 isoform X5 [Actinidia eriantha]|uniref:uncharacterized protein LOC130772868 isoform X5 n=1 Tax=Actinidia eriantha TaxID=165200 RepID=UPI00258801C6|nr:uncharacterized protein LOC130772868 isoform X5 [Actinidia eriantha]
MTKGMSSYVFVVYYNALTTVILFPIVFGRMKRASLTISRVCSLLGPLGSLAQMFAFIGLKFCSPTLKFAMSNLTQYIHICLPSYSGEGLCLCSHVQPVGDCHCCGHGSLVPWGSPYVGRVVGAVITTLGSVMWGKAKERRLVPDSGICSFESSSQRPHFCKKIPRKKYKAIFRDLFRNGVQTWCLQEKGSLLSWQGWWRLSAVAHYLFVCL